MSELDQEAFDQLKAETQEDREDRYGDGVFGHANLGLVWTSLLQNHYDIEFDHPVPGHLVCLMMAGNKLNRAALPTEPHVDDYVDASGYLDIARRSSPGPGGNDDAAE